MQINSWLFSLFVRLIEKNYSKIIYLFFSGCSICCVLIVLYVFCSFLSVFSFFVCKRNFENVKTEHKKNEMVKHKKYINENIHARHSHNKYRQRFEIN